MNEELSRKIDVYRIVDPIFRVHARLFNLQSSILKSTKFDLRTAKINSVGQGAIITGFIITLATILISILEVKWNSTPLLILYLIIAIVVTVYVMKFLDARSVSKQFDDLIIETGGEDIETWVDYSKSIIAAYGTRLKMIIEAQEENSGLHQREVISKDKHEKNNRYYEEIKKYCLSELEHIKQKNETLFLNKSRNEKDYNEIKEYLNIAFLE